MLRKRSLFLIALFSSRRIHFENRKLMDMLQDAVWHAALVLSQLQTRAENGNLSG